jgi:hypothetical protein
MACMHLNTLVACLRIANYTSQNEAEYIFAEMHGFPLHVESTACMGWRSITAIIGYNIE